MDSGRYFLSFLCIFLLTTAAVADDLREIYTKCVKDSSKGRSPADFYLECWNTPGTPTGTSALEPCFSGYYYLKCLQQMLDNTDFINCIGSDNKQTLETVMNVNHEEMLAQCNKDNFKSDTLTSVGACGGQHVRQLSDCASNIRDVEPILMDPLRLAGFTYDANYCRLLQEYNKCEESTVGSCESSAVALFRIKREAKWKATHCDSTLSNSSVNCLPASFWVILFSAILKIFI